MIVRLWALAWAARYLKYVPILGWRFSETIVQSIEERMERDVDVGAPAVEFEDGAPPTGLRIDVPVTNELPVDLTVSAVNLRIGYAEGPGTVVNLLWSEDAHGSPPGNVSCDTVESGAEGTVVVERYLDGHAPGDTLSVTGSITTRAWLDVPSTRRIPLGTLQRDVDGTDVAVPS